ncbi:OST-HTH/LOTUS domain-containing protein [Sinorhizobium fredii]|uniref:OST-HTH/LOTUS domain-containing protein n=1 Tax=Rhizobium fredii TaxID=380 RepID=UPI003511CECB
MAKQAPDFDARNYGFPRLSDLAKADGVPHPPRSALQPGPAGQVGAGRRCLQPPTVTFELCAADNSTWPPQYIVTLGHAAYTRSPPGQGGLDMARILASLYLRSFKPSRLNWKLNASCRLPTVPSFRNRVPFTAKVT